MAKTKLEQPLLLDGKPLDLAPIRPAFLRLAAFLDLQATHELFSPTELSEKSGIATDTVAQFRQAKGFTAYWYKSNSGRPSLYYGHPRAIERLRGQIAETK